MKRIRWLVVALAFVVSLAGCQNGPEPIKTGSFDTSRFGQATFK